MLCAGTAMLTATAPPERADYRGSSAPASPSLQPLRPGVNRRPQQGRERGYQGKKAPEMEPAPVWRDLGRAGLQGRGTHLCQQLSP